MRGIGSMLAGVCMLSPPAIAHADGVKIAQRLIDEDGWPSLVAHYSPDGSRGTVSWRACAPACGPVVATGSFYRPGPTVSGTTFEASTTVDGQTTTARSPVWEGQVTNTGPPTFDGELRALKTLTPRGGTWSGGWGDDRSLTGMRACPTVAAQDCRVMTDIRVTSAVLIDPVYVGWYVGAIEARIGSGTISPTIGLVFEPGKVSQYLAAMPARTVAAGPLGGPIIAAGGPGRVLTIGDPPRRRSVTVRTRAIRQRGALVLAAIRCSDRCIAHATLRHGRRMVDRRILVTGGRASVRLWPGSFPRRATVVRVSIRFDDHPATASGAVKLR